jgi:hypothetical protein
MKIRDLKHKAKSNNKKSNKNEKEYLKKILAPMVLEVIGKKYTDIYLKQLRDEYHQCIENIINKKRLSSSSNDNTKLFSDDESNYKSNYNKKEKSTFWKDYAFVKRPLYNNNIQIHRNNPNLVEISNNDDNHNNHTEEYEQTESMVIKNEEDNFGDE